MEPDKILNKLKENSEECIIKNRRSTFDFLFKFINIMSVLLWCFLFAVLLLCDKAGVRLFDINQKFYDLSNFNLFNLAVKLTIGIFVFGFFMCVIALKRARRRSDEILKKSLMISEVCSLIIGIFLLLKFI